jgi:rare lipoprotein A
MKQVLLTGLAAALTVTTVGKLSPSEASQDQRPIDESEAHPQAQQVSPSQVATEPTIRPQASSARVKSSSAPSKAQAAGVVKVGEVQSSSGQASAEPVVATIQVHQQNGRQAATVYVRNIPVVTMLGADKNAARKSGVKVATVDSNLGAIAESSENAKSSENDSSVKELSDPIWRATTMAGKLNQLSQSGLNAKDIKVTWNGKRKSYMVRTLNQHLLEVSEDSTVLPNTTKDAAQDALQITNRLRYQLGYAAPLKQVEGMPKKPAIRDSQTIAVGPVRFRVQGWASWYGPGFDGAYTASGERFNQYDLTAAHRSLPFGTKVRVTNLDNGRSVVVRITDRGPFVGGRVLDLSRGAAQILGTVGSGVSPIRMDILQ